MTRAAAANPVQPFSLGDPEALVRWTPAMRKKVFPRRELAPKPPKIASEDGIVAFLRAHADAMEPAVEAGRSLGGAARDAHDAAAVGREWLASGASEGLSVEAAAALLLVAPGPYLVDLWALRSGPEFALRALAASRELCLVGPSKTAFVAELPWGEIGAWGTRAHNLPPLGFFRAPAGTAEFAAEPPPGTLRRAKHGTPYQWHDAGPWLRLRQHLAALPDARWERCVAVGDELRGQGSAGARFWVAFAFPERPAWTEELMRDPSAEPNTFFQLAALTARTSEGIPWVRDHFYYREAEHAAHNILASSGPNAVRLLVEFTEHARTPASRRCGAGLLAQIDTDEAIRALLGLAASHKLDAAVAAAESNFPARVAALRASRLS